MAAELARSLGVPAAWVSQMAAGARPIPPHLCPSIERWTKGEVRRWNLRPNDWHLIWPELVDAADAPPVPGISAMGDLDEGPIAQKAAA